MNTNLQDRLSALNQEMVILDEEILYLEEVLSSTSGQADEFIVTLKAARARRQELQLQVSDLYNEICNG